MTEQTDSTLRSGLIDSLRACRDAERTIFAALDPTVRDAPGPDGGWSPKDHLAHLSAWRNRQATKMAALREGRPEPDGTGRGARRDERDLPRGTRRLDLGCRGRRRRRHRGRPDRRDPGGERRGAARPEGPRPDHGRRPGARRRPPRADRRKSVGLEDRVLALAATTRAIIDGGGWPDVSAAYARYNLACFHAQGGRLDEARALLRQALPEDESLRDVRPDRRRPHRAPARARGALRPVTAPDLPEMTDSTDTDADARRAPRAGVPQRDRPAGDAGTRLGRADALDRGWDDGRDGRRGLLVLPRRPRADPADPGRDQRTRSLAGRPGEPRLGSGHHRSGRRERDPDRGRGRHDGRPVRVGPRLRCRDPARDVVGAARVARHGRRRPQRPDPRPAPVRRGRGRVPPDDRCAPRRDRREGPADRRGRGPAGRADRARRRAGRAPERRHPRAPDAAVGRARLRRPARRGGRPPGCPIRPSANGATPHRTSSGGSIARSIRSSPRSAARA